jgi:hypothetical protein
MLKNSSIALNETITRVQFINSCTNRTWQYILAIYFQGALDIIGALLNYACIIIFHLIITKEKPKGNMYKYLMVKSINDAIFFSSDIFSVPYYCRSCSIKKSYIMQVWYVYFYSYGAEANLMFSGLIEIAATFDCLITIKNQLKCLMTRLAFYVILISMMTFSFLINIFYLWTINIVQVKENTTTFYSVESVELNSFYSLSITKSVIRDFIVVILLVAMNLVILILMKNLTLNRKNRMSKTQKNSKLINNAIEAEHKKIKMILTISLNYFLGHFLSIITNLPGLITNQTFQCDLVNIAWFMISLSSATPIFIYYFFNKTFRKYFKIRKPNSIESI